MDYEWNDSQPIYRQLRDRVVAMILDGVLNEGDPLPSVRNVAAEYRVNPLTVLKGYQLLVDEQLVNVIVVDEQLVDKQLVIELVVIEQLVGCVSAVDGVAVGRVVVRRHRVRTRRERVHRGVVLTEGWGSRPSAFLESKRLSVEGVRCRHTDLRLGIE